MMTRSSLTARIAQAASGKELDQAAQSVWALRGDNDLTDDEARELITAILARRADLTAQQTPRRPPDAGSSPTPQTTLPAGGAAAGKLNQPAKTASTARGSFFSVDLGAFRCAAAGGLNPAIAHLIMARGTGRDNRTTQWSVHAIEQHSGISRPNAAKAIQDLLHRGVWKKIREGRHPIYQSVPGNEIPGGPFTVAEQEAIDEIRAGKIISSRREAIAEMLLARNLVAKARGFKFKLDAAAIDALSEPKAVWLPNTLIDGAADEVAPVELLRQTRQLPGLQLLIELYAVQFLPSYGGVPHELLKIVFERVKVGEQGPFVVWGFRAKHLFFANPALVRPFFTGQIKSRDDGRDLDAGYTDSFCPAVDTFIELGLVECVGMLLDGDDDKAEIIHPYAMRDGEPAECELYRAVKGAAMSMLTEGQINWAAANHLHLVPVQKHIGKVALVEIFRLKYRPHTTATAAWYAQMRQTTDEYIRRYQVLMQSRTRRRTG
jgi:hypothetical protein